jgi:hypothetical protein
MRAWTPSGTSTYGIYRVGSLTFSHRCINASASRREDAAQFTDRWQRILADDRVGFVAQLCEVARLQLELKDSIAERTRNLSNLPLMWACGGDVSSEPVILGTQPPNLVQAIRYARLRHRITSLSNAVDPVPPGARFAFLHAAPPAGTRAPHGMSRRGYTNHHRLILSFRT